MARVPVSIERTVYRVLREYSAHGDEAPATANDGVDALGDLRLDVATFAPLGGGTRRLREIRCGNLRFNARAPRNPFGSPYGTVECDRPCAAGGPHRTASDAPTHVPLALPGSWVFVLDDGSGAEAADRSASGSAAGPMISGELVVFLAAGPTEEQIPSVAASLRDRLSIVANDLAANR